MKKLALTTAILIYCLLYCSDLSAQGYVTLVADAKLTAALMVNHAVTMGALTGMAAATESIREDQEDIASKAFVMREIADMAYKSLSEVSFLIKEGENLREVRRLTEEIAKYQSEIAGHVSDNPNPALVTLAAEAGTAMVHRSVALLGYVYESALTTGDDNLISSSQRMAITRNVIRELRSIRALAFETSRRIRTASRAQMPGSAHGSTHLFGLPYPETGEALVQSLLNDLQP